MIISTKREISSQRLTYDDFSSASFANLTKAMASQMSHSLKLPELQQIASLQKIAVPFSRNEPTPFESRFAFRDIVRINYSNLYQPITRRT